MTLNMNNGRARFSEFTTLIHKLIFVKIICIQHPKKMTMEPLKPETNLYNTNITNNFIKLKKGKMKLNRILAELC